MNEPTPEQEQAPPAPGQTEPRSQTEAGTSDEVDMRDVIPETPGTNEQGEGEKNKQERAIETAQEFASKIQEHLKKRRLEKLSEFIKHIAENKISYKDMADDSDAPTNANWDPAKRVASYAKGEGIELYENFLNNKNQDIILSHEMGHAIIEEINPALCDNIYDLFEKYLLPEGASDNETGGIIEQALPMRVREMIKRMKDVDQNASNYQEELDYYRNEVAAELTGIWLDAQAKEGSDDTDILAIYMKRLSSDQGDIETFNQQYGLDGTDEENAARIRNTPFAKLLNEMNALMSSELADDKLNLEEIKQRQESTRERSGTPSLIPEEGFNGNDYGHAFGGDPGLGGRETPYQGAGGTDNRNPVWEGFLALL